MKWIMYLSCLFLAGITGLSAQQPVDSLHVAEAQPLFNADSLRREALAQRARIAGEMAKADIRYFVIRVPDEKFGYSIFIDGTLYIEQTSIPAMQGNAGFSTIKDAEKVALLVIEKIKQGEMPPTISMEELGEMKIVN